MSHVDSGERWTGAVIGSLALLTALGFIAVIVYAGLSGPFDWKQQTVIAVVAFLAVAAVLVYVGLRFLRYRPNPEAAPKAAWAFDRVLIRNRGRIALLSALISAVALLDGIAILAGPNRYARMAIWALGIATAALTYCGRRIAAPVPSPNYDWERVPPSIRSLLEHAASVWNVVFIASGFLYIVATVFGVRHELYGALVGAVAATGLAISLSITALFFRYGEIKTGSFIAPTRKSTTDCYPPRPR